MVLISTPIERIVLDPWALKCAYMHHAFDNVQTIDTQIKEGMVHIQALVDVMCTPIQCALTLNADGSILSHECTCTHPHSEHACAHIGALILKCAKVSIEGVPYHFENDVVQARLELYNTLQHKVVHAHLDTTLHTSRTLMKAAQEKYEQAMVSLIQKESYTLEPQLNWYGERNICVSYKIGHESAMYAVKNIKGLLEHIHNEARVVYGKKLTLLHKRELFDEPSKLQIDFLTHQHNERVQTLGYYEGARAYKQFSLDKQNIDAFYNLYKEGEYAHLSFADIDDKIHLEIKKTGDVYTLKGPDTLPYIEGKAHLYRFENNLGHITIARLPFSEGGLSFLHASMNEGGVRVLVDELAHFKKYVLGDALAHMDVSTNAFEEPASTLQQNNIYADVDEVGDIFVRVEYVDEDNQKQAAFSSSYVSTFAQDYIEQYIRTYAHIIEVDNGIAHFDGDSEHTYTFIKDGLQALREYGDVYISDALKSIDTPISHQISVGVRLDGDLLRIDVDSVNIPPQELMDILHAHRKKKKFYRLKSGEMLFLHSDELQSLTHFMEENHLQSKDFVDNSIALPTYRMFSLEDSSTSNKVLSFHKNDAFIQKIHQFYTSEGSAPLPLNKQYTDVLRPYQDEGVQWLYTLHNFGFNGILADDMGLGKTLQVLALLEHLQKKTQCSLIVCPTSLVYNWQDEIVKFSTQLSSCCIVGTKQERLQAIQNCTQYDIAITSYEYLRRDIEAYEDCAFFYTVLDEAQYIKNQKTKNAASVKRLSSTHKIALSGTPIENSLAELWSIFDFLMPHYLYSYHHFNTHYEKPIVKEGNQEKQAQLKRLVTPFILRRNKKEVLTELPDKIEKTVHLKFSEDESKLYYAHAMQANKQLQALNEEGAIDKIAILALLTKLRQLCCEPRLLFDSVKHASTKVQAALDIVKECKENKQHVLLFSSFTSLLDLVREELSNTNISSMMLSGKSSKEERKEMVARFQRKEVDVFLISLKAGGTGLNLTAAEAVIHFDPWWNKSAQNQATDRAYRFGQHNNVQVFELVMKNSVEERIQALQNQKKELSDIFVEGNTGSLSSMSEQDILDLFKVD